MKKKPFFIAASALVLSISTLAAAFTNIRPAQASIMVDGIEYFTAPELEAVGEELKTTISIACIGSSDPYCEYSKFSNYTANGEAKYRAYGIYDATQVAVTSVNPIRASFSLLYRDTSYVLRRYNNVSRYVNDLYVVWSEVGSLNTRNVDTTGRYAGVTEYVRDILAGRSSSRYHIVLSEQNVSSWFRANHDMTFTTAGKELYKSPDSTLYISLYDNTDDTFSFGADYSSCLTSPDYRRGMECTLAFGADGSQRYIPTGAPLTASEVGDDEASEAAVSSREELLNARNALAEADAALSDANYRLSGANTTITKLENDLSASEQTVSEKELVIEKLNRIILSQESDIATTNEVVADLRGQLASAETNISEKDVEIEAKMNEIAGKNAEIEAKNSEILEQNATIDAKTAEINEKSTKIIDLEEQLATLSQKLATAEAEAQDALKNASETAKSATPDVKEVEKPVYVYVEKEAPEELSTAPTEASSVESAAKEDDSAPTAVEANSESAPLNLPKTAMPIDDNAGIDVAPWIASVAIIAGLSGVIAYAYLHFNKN
ncbi:hypothetical protein IJ135_02405 [Candidatus Saccharibacteria bacterium]|nr:hypothetical protein [Candidatus Saccharibacteria bacterium]